MYIILFSVPCMGYTSYTSHMVDANWSVKYSSQSIASLPVCKAKPEIVLPTSKNGYVWLMKCAATKQLKARTSLSIRTVFGKL